MLKKHLIDRNYKIIEALAKLNELAIDAILFVVDENNVLLGSLTDGDIRRGLLKGYSIEDNVENFVQPDPSFLYHETIDIKKIIQYRNLNFKIIPIVNTNKQIIDLLNFRFKISYLPINVIVMAGGKGMRLRPLTDNIPKPLLNVGNKPILQLLLHHLIKFGVKEINISINYLKEQIIDFINNNRFETKINLIEENKPLGTIGSVSNISNIKDDEIYLIINSDILTNINIEKFLLDFYENQSDLSVLTVPYNIDIPYGVIESDFNEIILIKEKPTYNYKINSGIYLLKSQLLKLVPKDTFYNMTDLIQNVLKLNKKVTSYNSSEYWLDIGKMDDYKKAQIDVKTL